ncbi:MAG TPA: hypothetical protein VFB16_09765, partial [Bauldia sp.]|nr:hypothetical protein [Bauldia sp.]
MNRRARLIWPAIVPAFFLFAAIAFAGLLSATRPAAASAETDCYNFVQGNIPWNYTGSSSWNPSNVKNLCKGTSKAAEPGRCFDRVMTGGINWGGGTEWQWQNALNLCKGTNNANATISCFQGKIAAGVQWPQAIPACNGSGPPPASTTAAETACFNFVQGNIPWNYAGSATWNPANVKNLCKGTSKAAEPGRCFDRVMTGGINWGGGTEW